MSKPLNNPFVYGGPVDVSQFIGRKNEVNKVLDQLSSHARGSIAIIGERRIGKTSFLHYVSAPDVIKHWNLDVHQSIFIFQDCGAISPFTITSFWKTVLRRLERELKKANSFLVKTVQELLGKDTITASDIEFLLDDLHDHDYLLILRLDEFEALVRTDVENEAITRDFLAGLRALINHVPRVLSLIVATRQPLDRVCKDVRFMGSPFYNNFVFVHLRPFNQEEAELLFEQVLADTGISFSQAEKDYIYGLAGTHPLLLQIAASLLFDFKVGGAREIQDLFPIREQFREAVEHQFEDFWKWSLPREREILTHLANGDEEKAGAQLESWADERRTLLRRGLIVERQEKYRIFSPVFQEWLVENFYRLEGTQGLKGPEPGALTKFSPIQAASPLVFISYNHKDEAQKEALMAQLGVLQRGSNLIDVWSEDQIGGGEDWEKEINKAIGRAKVAILLISANFLASDFITGKEIPAILQRYEGEGVTIIPVIAKPCAWRKIEWLAKMKVRPKDGKAVWRENGIHVDEELSVIAEEIADIVSRGYDNG